MVRATLSTLTQVLRRAAEALGVILQSSPADEQDVTGGRFQAAADFQAKVAGDGSDERLALGRRRSGLHCYAPISRRNPTGSRMRRSRIAFLKKLRRFGPGRIHQVEQILITRNDKPGVCCKCKVDVMCVVGVTLIGKEFGEALQKGRGAFPMASRNSSTRSATRCSFAMTFGRLVTSRNSSITEGETKRLTLRSIAELDASARRSLCRGQGLEEGVAIENDSRSGRHPARFSRRSARMACFSDSRKSESSSSLMPAAREFFGDGAADVFQRFRR